MLKPVLYLNSNDGTGLLGFGEGLSIKLENHDQLKDFQNFFQDNEGKYIFGYLSYDLKNYFYPITSENFDGLMVPDAFFWIPKYVVKIEREQLTFVQGKKDIESLNFLSDFLEEESDRNHHENQLSFTARISKNEYLEKVKELKNHIQRGDIYEINFCQEFYAEQCDIPFELDTYFKLNTITKAPFSAFFKFENFSVFCGSPERFIQKKGNRLISQPIKGTSPRGNTIAQDEFNKQSLSNNPKERSENVMIVDLVRNDLAQVSKVNSVRVDELFGLYTFETVHQMISTVSCELNDNENLLSILKATFPMGSMTGAPKLRAMELIEKYESFKRGMFSGSIGYISPNGDADFNVVIRSLIYNAETKYASCSVGSAITIDSDPEQEYEECMIKVKRIMDSLNA
jgi:para-aminobenzoate synthetase component 1